ncbi:MAG: SDR family NAD(P)-dependent oxidoreductase [Eubacteriales bacterium]
MKEQNKASAQTTPRKFNGRRRLIFFYDLIMLLVAEFLIFGINPSGETKLQPMWLTLHIILATGCVFACRLIGKVYNQVWRYGGASAYIRLILSDFVAGVIYYVIQRMPFFASVEFIRVLSFAAINLLLVISLRLAYHYLYELFNRSGKHGGLFWSVISIISGLSISADVNPSPASAEKPDEKARIAIAGAGRVGVMLAEELLNNPHAHYTPCFFIDVDRSKIGREIMNLPVFSDDDALESKIESYKINEIVFALPQVSPERKKELYDHYKETGCRIKVYDFPVMQNAASGKRRLREFDIEELLFREPINVKDSTAADYYRDKVVLITGGGGSIGSELCRQIAQMGPKKLVILDVYENGAYDLEQDLKRIYKDALNVQVEIVSVTDRQGLEKVMATHRPDVLLHAAAHKHVPLMEHNCCEAVKNNVFGTLNAVELAEKYHVGRFIMVSTDKAVNPTNVMGATKRMCEMIVLSHASERSHTVFSATRFGNVLGSAGSVIPLFKRQIAGGGPVTVTDKRIIRYFMTIPEASQLVLQSGVMANNGELFVLDMGKPIKILELAENMIRLSGFKPYDDIDIIETGLRPGEKLYEELLIKTEELDKTANSMIFIERDAPLSSKEISEKLAILQTAVNSGDDASAKRALKEVVPTFREPSEVNATAKV